MYFKNKNNTTVINYFTIFLEIFVMANFYSFPFEPTLQEIWV